MRQKKRQKAKQRKKRELLKQTQPQKVSGMEKEPQNPPRSMLPWDLAQNLESLGRMSPPT